MSTTAIQLQCLQTQCLGPRTEDRVSKRPVSRQLLPALFLFIVLVAQLWIRIAFISKGYQLEELRRKALHSDVQLREQRLEYALLTRPATLSQSAREKLGMVQLEPQRIRKFGE
jgi:hypothetical protein